MLVSIIIVNVGLQLLKEIQDYGLEAYIATRVHTDQGAQTMFVYAWQQ